MGREIAARFRCGSRAALGAVAACLEVLLEETSLLSVLLVSLQFSLVGQLCFRFQRVCGPQ